MMVKSVPLALVAIMVLATGAEASTRNHRYHHVWRAVYAHESHHASGMLSSVIPALAAKAHEITAACGARVISGFRPHAVVAGTNRTSLHASGHAVDIQGNPGCIYSHLHGFRGGYSVDYSAVQHVHVSLGGREDGARFVHGGGHRHSYRRHRTWVAWS